MDCIMKLPPSKGYDSILTITDHDCTKAALFIPCNETITSEGVAKLYLQHTYPHYGIPKKLIMDRGSQFILIFMRNLCHVLGSNKTFHQHTTLRPMGSQNAAINGLSNSYNTGATPNKTTGQTYSLLPSLLTIHGPMRQQKAHHLNC